MAIAGTSSNPTAFGGYDPSNKRVWRSRWAYSGSWARTEDEITFWSVTGQKLATYNVTQYNGDAQSTRPKARPGTISAAEADQERQRLGRRGSPRLHPASSFPTASSAPSAATNGFRKNSPATSAMPRPATTTPTSATSRRCTERFVTPGPRAGHPRVRQPGSWNRYAYTLERPGEPTGPERQG